MLKFLSLSALSTLGGFFILSKLMAVIVTVLGARGTADLAIFPSFLLLLMFFGLLLLPLQNLFSRILERQADRYSLDKVAGSGVFISVMQKLARINLSETDPPLWKKVLLYDHPPISERIEMARRTVRECDERT
jgi:Zn-dependent protease with chaperone function